MLILGIDPAQNTGFAYYDDSRSLSSMQAGVFRCPLGRKVPIENKAWHLGREFMKLLRDRRPDLVAIEEPGRRQFNVASDNDGDLVGDESHGPRTTGLASIISSNQIVGGYSMLCGIKNIPIVTIPPASWRKQFLGFGTHKGWQRSDWKRATRERCAALKITVTNDDMADACGVAFAATGHPDFKWMKHRAEQERTAA